MNELIEKARELCEKATAGPWFVHESHNWHKDPPKEYFVITRGMKDIVASWVETSDASFIAASRTLIPALADALEEALRSEAEREDTKPLTVEELKQMKGKPIWTIGVSFTDDGTWSMWDIVEEADDDGITFGYSTEHCEWWNYNLRGADGKLCGCAWLAYAHRPKDTAPQKEEKG